MPAPRPKKATPSISVTSPCRTTACSQSAQASRSASSVSLLPGTSTAGTSIARRASIVSARPECTEAKSPTPTTTSASRAALGQASRLAEVRMQVAEGQQPHGATPRPCGRAQAARRAPASSASSSVARSARGARRRRERIASSTVAQADLAHLVLDAAGGGRIPVEAESLVHGHQDITNPLASADHHHRSAVGRTGDQPLADADQLGADSKALRRAGRRPRGSGSHARRPSPRPGCPGRAGARRAGAGDSCE